MSKKDKILHLVLKREWFEKIKSGEKKTEYRAFSPYWNKRFEYSKYIDFTQCWRCPYDVVIFHNGYTNETISFQIDRVKCLTGVANDLCADPVWAIQLGRRIK